MLFGALSALVAPAKEEKMAKPGVEPVRIRMLIVEVRGGGTPIKEPISYQQAEER